MPIRWVQTTSTVWVAGLQQYRAGVFRMGDVWIARVEDGVVLCSSNITFYTLEGAQTWAEHTLHELPCRSGRVAAGPL